MDGGEGANVVANERHRVTLIANDEGKRAPIALTHDDNALALAAGVRLQAAVLTIFLPVFRLHVAAEIAAVDLDNAVEGGTGDFAAHGFAQLVKQHEGGLVLNVQIAA